MSETFEYFLVKDEWTEEVLSSLDKERWECFDSKNLYWLDSIDSSAKFNSEEDANKAIKKLEKEFIEYGTPPEELDFKILLVQSEMVKNFYVTEI